MHDKSTRITGSVRIEPRDGYRVWVAKYGRAEGGSTRRVLGPAWAKDSGRRTPRGAVVWRAADGPKPSDAHLTPKEAQDALARLLGDERAKPAVGRTTVAGKTWGDAVVEWLTYVEHDKQIAPSTLRRYRSIVDVHLLPAFGERTPLRRVTTERIAAYRDQALAQGRLSRASIRQELVVVNGVLKRAKRRGWVSHNAAADVEPITTSASGDFKVLDPAQVEAVARAAHADWQPVPAGPREHTRVGEQRAKALTAERRAMAAQHAAMIRFAAHTGLRLGELRALRWRDVDFGKAVVHVRRNAPTSAPADSVERAPKSGRVRSVPLTDHAARTLDVMSRRPLFVEPEDRVFPTSTGGVLDGGKVRDAFYRALTAAGLGHMRDGEAPVTFHDLRHTFGTLAVQAFPVTDVQAFMGHSHIATTMRYVHHVPRHDAARRLSAAFAVDAVTDTEPAAV